MAMGQVRGQAATLQVAMVCLDELVPEHDRYRRMAGRTEPLGRLALRGEGEFPHRTR